MRHFRRRYATQRRQSTLWINFRGERGALGRSRPANTERLDLRGRDSCADDHRRRSPPLVFGRLLCCCCVNIPLKADVDGVAVGLCPCLEFQAPLNYQSRSAMRQFAKRSSSSLRSPPFICRLRAAVYFFDFAPTMLYCSVCRDEERKLKFSRCASDVARAFFSI